MLCVFRQNACLFVRIYPQAGNIWRMVRSRQQMTWVKWMKSLTSGLDCIGAVRLQYVIDVSIAFCCALKFATYILLYSLSTYYSEVTNFFSPFVFLFTQRRLCCSNQNQITLELSLWLFELNWNEVELSYHADLHAVSMKLLQNWILKRNNDWRKQWKSGLNRSLRMHPTEPAILQ